MKITVNGQDINCNDNLTVSELLVEQKVKMPEMISVELNGEILRRNKFDQTALNENDRLEFLYFMGGGKCL